VKSVEPPRNAAGYESQKLRGKETVAGRKRGGQRYDRFGSGPLVQGFSLEVIEPLVMGGDDLSPFRDNDGRERTQTNSLRYRSLRYRLGRSIFVTKRLHLHG
jgi:hypothetical protein